MKLKNRIDLTLKQITPMLHFQSQQAGACLRASEVKPKLDRFVISWLRKQGLASERLPRDWVIRNSQSGDSLRYRLHFTACGSNAWPEDRPPHPLYFAASMRGSKAGCVFYPEGVKMTVFTLAKAPLPMRLSLPDGRRTDSMMDVLEALIPPFLAVTCFGIRSTKGFGSFEVKGYRCGWKQLMAYLPTDITGLFQLNAASEGADEGTGIPSICDDRLDDVFVLSAMMKGGVNYAFRRPPVWYRGAVMEYADRTGFGTEKAFLKSRVFTPADRSWYEERILRHKDGNTGGRCTRYRFMRAMLGLTDSFIYGSGDSKKVFKIEPVLREIDRFPSPVRFKPCEQGLRIVVRRIPDAMFGTRFIFDQGGSTILTPDRSEFDLCRFVQEFVRPFSPEEAPPPAWEELNCAVLKVDRDTPWKRHIRFARTLSRLTLAGGGEVP